MKFKFEIECDNAAFDGDRFLEVALLLQETSRRVALDRPPTGVVFDTNGNRVGKWSFEDE